MRRRGKPLPARRATDWDCPICKFPLFASKNKCGKCQYRKGDWFCAPCQIGNDPSQGNCSQCNNPRPVPAGAPAAAAAAVAAAPPDPVPSLLQKSLGLSDEQFRDKVLTMLGTLEKRMERRFTTMKAIAGEDAAAPVNPGPTPANAPSVYFIGVASPAAATVSIPPTTEQSSGFDKEQFKASMREYGPAIVMPALDLRDPPGLTDAQRMNATLALDDALNNQSAESKTAWANVEASMLAHSTAATANVATATTTATIESMEVEEKMCKICFDEAVAVAMIPCGHRFACKECAPAMKGKACAICRTPVNDILITFDS